MKIKYLLNKLRKKKNGRIYYMEELITGRIYVLKSFQTDDVYIGSTIQTIKRRLSGHKSDYIRYNKDY